MRKIDIETLKPDTQKWVRHVLKAWDLAQHHERLLLLAGQAWDRSQQAREILDRDGLTTATGAGVKSHPCVAIEINSRQQFARLVRELQLDVAPDDLRAPPLYQ